MTVKQSGKTQGESDCKAGRKNSRRKSTCNCLFLVPPGKYSIILTVFASNHSILLRFLPSFLGEIYPSRCPFFFRPFFSLFFVYLLIFRFFCLFLVPPEKYSIIATVFAADRSILRRFLPSFLAKIYPSRCPFFSSLFGLFFVFWLFCGYFSFFLSLLSTPRESDCKAERGNSRRK